MKMTENQSLTTSLQEFTQRHSIEIPASQWEFVMEGQRHEIEDGLYQVFEGHGIEGMSETGTSAEEYMPSIILGSLGLLECDDWSLQELSSDDGWLTAKVELLNESGSEYLFTIEEVDDCDWVAFDVFTKLNAFAKQFSFYSLVLFCSDDPFRVVALEHEIEAELQSIIENFSEPY